MSEALRSVRARAALVLVALVATVITLPTASPAAAAVTFSVRGSMEQVATWGHAPGTGVELVDAGSTVVDAAAADAQGAVLFRAVAPRAGYVVRTAEGDSEPVTVIDPEVHPDPSIYEGVELAEGYGYLPTRDGTTLSINVGFPLDGSPGPWPVLVDYSGYDPADPAGLPPETLPYRLLGYVVVGVNMRGTGCSGGSFDFFEWAQRTDGYDAIETVARQPWSDGNVGMVGISYPGISQLYVASTQPPSLGAITPLSPYSDAYRGILYPGGIRNEGFALGWALERQEAAKPLAAGWARRRVDQDGDTECAENQVLRLQSQDLEAEIQPDRYDVPELRYLDITTLASRIEVPTYLASQFQDEQTGGSAVALTKQLQGRDIPFRATFTNGAHVEPLGPTELPRVAEFFEFYLHNKVPDLEGLGALLPIALNDIFDPPIEAPPNRFDPTAPFEEELARYEAEPPIRVRYENGGVAGKEGAPYATAEGGYDAWPIPSTQVERWYLQPDGALATAAPTIPGDQPRGASGYRYDPDDGREKTFDGGTGDMWKRHPDVRWESPTEGTALTFTTPPATTKTVYAGTGSADLWIRSDAPDTDLEAVLTEVRPDGHEVNIQSGWLRASHRALDEARSTDLVPYQTHAEADLADLPAGEWSQVRVPLFPFAHIVRPGSSLRLSIEAPGGNQPFWAFTDLDGIAANQVAHSADFASSVALPRVPDEGVASTSPEVAPSCSVPGVTVQAQSLRGQPCRDDRAPRRATGVAAAAGAGDGTVDVSWTPAADWAGGSGPTGYEVTLSPGGETVSVGADTTTASFTDVGTGVPVTAVVRAVFADGPGLDSNASLAVTLEQRSVEERFVDAAYSDFLGRAPTESERSTAAAALVAGTVGRGTVVRALAASPEWATTIVADLYLSTLGRPGEASGTAYWAERISSGSLTVAQVAARFYSSDEYVRRFPAGDVGAWVDDLYREVLGRPSDTAGRAYWVGIVSARGRTSVALSIYQSPESARTRVDGLYRTLLGRAADPAGLAFWAPRVVTRGDVALAVDLAASSEYLARAQTR